MLSSGANGGGEDHPDRTPLQSAPGSRAHPTPMRSRRARAPEEGRIRPATPGRGCLVPRGGSGVGGGDQEQFSRPPPRPGVHAGSARDHTVVRQRSPLEPEGERLRPGTGQRRCPSEGTRGRMRTQSRPNSSSRR